MNGPAAEERIAQLQARAQAERLATQLAIHEAREELAPLRSAAGVIGAAARALSAGATAGGIASTLAKTGMRYPWVASIAAGAALKVLRRRPITLLIAAAAGAAAWWLLRPPARERNAAPPE
jgi:hypothetical protein